MQTNQTQLEQILERGGKAEIRALFHFDDSSEEREIIFLFNIWARHFYPKFFKAPDAPFHRLIDKFNCRVYLGTLKYFVDIVFRNGAKTTRTKLFIAFCIANDAGRRRRYFKVLTKDGGNSQQIVTDIYNLLINQRVQFYYDEIFEKTVEKREERMSSFTTATGIKVRADTVGTDQRGDIQEDARPDFIWFDDFETRKTLRSPVETKAIWDNMEEAKNGLAKGGGAVYTANYLSERGNVHRLVESPTDSKQLLIVPIIKDGVPAWSAYTVDEIDKIRADAEDFEGEYLCEPSAGLDIFFDRECLKSQVERDAIRTVGGFKMFYDYNPSHRYGSGHDTAGGVGLDSSTSVFIDFSTIPSRVVATFKSNDIKPNIFGDEIKNEADRYGAPIVAVENNKYDMVIGRLAQIYDNLYFTQRGDEKVPLPQRPKTYGWNTNADTKPKMLFALKSAVEDGHLQLTDADLIKELNSYTRDDLMDREQDPRLVTRHFDLLTAAAIAYQMKDFAQIHKPVKTYKQPAYERPGFDSDSIIDVMEEMQDLAGEFTPHRR